MAPFQVHLLGLTGKDDQAVGKESEKVYKTLLDSGIEVLYDDRQASAGEKFADSDLIGIPWRAVVSKKTDGKIELKKRNTDKTKLVSTQELVKTLKK